MNHKLIMGKTKTAVMDISVEEVLTPSTQPSPLEGEGANAESTEEIPSPLVGEGQGEGDNKKEPKIVEPGQKYRSKKYLEAQEKVEKTKAYNLDEALQLVKDASYSKFEGTVELHINTSQKNLRGLVSLPFSSGKSLKVAALGKGAADSGADVVVDDAMLSDIEKGRINFDVLVVSPDQMPKIARMAKVLGPRGLMPNPKSGTISDDLKKAVAELQGGKTEYKTQKDSQVIHLSVGKINQDPAELSANIKTLYQTLGKSRIKGMILAPSMGPGIKVNPNSL